MSPVAAAHDCRQTLRDRARPRHPLATADPETVRDLGWFEEHRERCYYARAVVVAGTRLTALIHRATRLPDRKTDRDGRAVPPPVLLRTYAQLERLPETEGACQAAWQKAAWPHGRRS
jgi:hypothetical protein